MRTRGKIRLARETRYAIGSAMLIASQEHFSTYHFTQCHCVDFMMLLSHYTQLNMYITQSGTIVMLIDMYL